MLSGHNHVKIGSKLGNVRLTFHSLQYSIKFGINEELNYQNLQILSHRRVAESTETKNREKRIFASSVSLRLINLYNGNYFLSISVNNFEKVTVNEKEMFGINFTDNLNWEDIY